MEITNVKIFKAKQRGTVLAYANVILDNKFIIRGITLIERESGRFLSMPSRRLEKGKRHFRDVCHPLTSEVRDELTEKVFNAYEEFIANENE